LIWWKERSLGLLTISLFASQQQKPYNFVDEEDN